MNRVIEERMVSKRLLEALLKVDDWVIRGFSELEDRGGGKLMTQEIVRVTRGDGLWVERHGGDAVLRVGCAPHEVPQAVVQFGAHPDQLLSAWENLVNLRLASRDRRPALDLLGVDR